MDCTAASIKELLPSYLEGALGPDERTIVERHLESCPDCAGELDLLRTLADEPVPDPGEAFWTSLPERIYRVVRHAQRSVPPTRISDLLVRLAPPRWGWAAAAAVVIVASLLLLQPIFRHAPVRSGARPAPAPDIIAEALNGAEIRPGDLDRLSSWAHQELLALHNGLVDAPVNMTGIVSSGVDIEETLAGLSDDELENLINTLSEKDEEGSV